MKKIVDLHAAEIKKDYNIDPSEIGIHSYRKQAHTRLNCGTTDGPSGAAASIRGGHSLGSVKNVYVQQEKASDYYCGRILSGLPVNDVRFAVSHPDFIPIDVDASLLDSVFGGGVSESEFDLKCKQVNEKVDSVLESMFDKKALANFQTIHKFL